MLIHRHSFFKKVITFWTIWNWRACEEILLSFTKQSHNATTESSFNFMVKYKIYHFCLSIQSPTTDKIHSVCLAHVGRRLTMLKGTQDPSIQVNSGQVTLVFLLPGGAGETVLSEQNKISKNYQTERDYTHYHEVCEYGRVGCRLFLSSFPYFFLSLSMLPFLHFFFASILWTFCQVLSPCSISSLHPSSLPFSPVSSPYLRRTHHTPTHLRPADSLERRCTLATCSRRCGCHMGSCLDKEVSE